MNNISYYNREEILNAVKSNIKTADIVLDIGCGIRPQDYITPLIHLCCEPYEEYRQHLEDEIKKRASHFYLILPADWRKAVETIPPKSVDTVFLLDVIEHLEKEEGLELLKITENIARNQVILFTPLGFMHQAHPDGIDAWGLHGGLWQEHKSGWLPEEFSENWDFFICEDFHEFDNNGNKLEKPFGAFWAIKNIVDYSYDNNQLFDDVLSIYNKFELSNLDLFKSIINGLRPILDNNDKLLEEHQIVIERLQNQYLDLQIQYKELHSNYYKLYNSPFSKFDRRLDRHPFIRFIIRTIYRSIKSFFKSI